MSDSEEDYEEPEICCADDDETQEQRDAKEAAKAAAAAEEEAEDARARVAEAANQKAERDRRSFEDKRKRAAEAEAANQEVLDYGGAGGGGDAGDDDEDDGGGGGGGGGVGGNSDDEGGEGQTVLGRNPMKAVPAAADDQLDEDAALALEEQEDEENRNLQEAMEWQRSSIPVADYSEEHAFEDQTVEEGATAGAKKLWSIWDAHLRDIRNNEHLHFEMKRHYGEDLAWGQRVAHRRLWSSGFKRHPDDNTVVWTYWTGTVATTVITHAGVKDTEILQLLIDNKTGDELGNVRIEPHREGETSPAEARQAAALGGDNYMLSPGANAHWRTGVNRYGGNRRKVRNTFNNTYVEDPHIEGQYAADTVGRQLQQHLQYKRNEDGTFARDDLTNEKILVDRNRKVYASTRAIRLQIISIRLNAHHWEWQYSRYLKN